MAKEPIVKLRETEFFQQFVAVVAGVFLAVASFAFLAIPLSIAPAEIVRHLT